MANLKMIRRNLEGLPPVVLPDGCEMRTYNPGDEEVWAEIMNTGIGEGWTAGRVKLELTDKPQFDPEGLFFVTLNDAEVGTACAWRLTPEEQHSGYVHMVCVLPEARGMNLGYLVTLQVLHRLKETGFTEAWLATDDFRVPAIKAYLRLGFEPLIENQEHEETWRKVMDGIRC